MFDDFCDISVPSMHIHKYLLFVRRDIYDGVEAGWMHHQRANEIPRF